MKKKVNSSQRWIIIVDNNSANENADEIKYYTKNK